MAQAYTPGLLVTPRTRWRCRRVLPVQGLVLADMGQQVAATTVVAETELPGDAQPVNLARQLGVPPARLPGLLTVSPGTPVTAGQVLARTNGFLGWFVKEFRAPIDGTLESVSSVTGLAIVRGAPRKVQVRAYLAGKIVEVLPQEGVVVEADAAVVQGIFGIGGEAYGPLALAAETVHDDLTAERIRPEHRGAIVVGGRQIHRSAVDRAREVGVAALIAGGIDDEDLRAILGHDLGVAVTGSEQIGLSLIVTEGFGEIAMAQRTFRLLQQLAGQQAAANGTTQIRAGVLRPEIIVPVAPTGSAVSPEVLTAGVLAPGAPIRVIREPYFGDLGSVEDLPAQPQVLESGTKARVVRVVLADGRSVVVPRANVELMEG